METTHSANAMRSRVDPMTGARMSESYDSWAVLKAEIEDLIMEYTTPEAGKPPFSTAQLVVMAGICSHEATATETTTMRWILRSFPYYSRQAIEAYIAAHQAFHDTATLSG
ncbi:hypothetical protein B0A55_05912 [Friedmanniomyces simplex]|uniref:Uncharacterized protein n=1 Tax=Friedmanniomyces simplex TaxID=329884 RepID=A0A4V5NGN9_9PEZI|nr:hypothetical protein B0A55_05912 [Friedmanniomyces simplex]